MGISPNLNRPSAVQMVLEIYLSSGIHSVELFYKSAKCFNFGIKR